MASSLVARVARQAASVARLSSSQPSTAQAMSLVLCRGLAGAASLSPPLSPSDLDPIVNRCSRCSDHVLGFKLFEALMYSPPRVNAWQDPMSPSKWKELSACHGSCKSPSVTLKTIQVDGRQEMTL
ncbi:hypothetical protein Vadar_033069 [Vaccinium darrowii]|uniref:Uncharacterized protein n=1 Tax=Vaccinium darrowii TaxID=229202 RepID=A0ACB7Z936_9ERIC|nr:hypothetical protein Vadar_033069 [Vaccinium darrowii]